MDLRVGTKVRFNEPHRPPQVRWGAIGVIVDMDAGLSALLLFERGRRRFREVCAERRRVGGTSRRSRYRGDTWTAAPGGRTRL